MISVSALPALLSKRQTHSSLMPLLAAKFVILWICSFAVWTVFYITDQSWACPISKLRRRLPSRGMSTWTTRTACNCRCLSSLEMISRSILTKFDSGPMLVVRLPLSCSETNRTFSIRLFVSGGASSLFEGTMRNCSKFKPSQVRTIEARP